MRGIKQAIEEIKQADPYTALTEKALRRLILTKEIPSVKIGAKYLINMDVLNNYLCTGTTESGNKKNSRVGQYDRLCGVHKRTGKYS